MHTLRKLIDRAHHHVDVAFQLSAPRLPDGSVRLPAVKATRLMMHLETAADRLRDAVAILDAQTGYSAPREDVVSLAYLAESVCRLVLRQLRLDRRDESTDLAIPAHEVFVLDSIASALDSCHRAHRAVRKLAALAA